MVNGYGSDIGIVGCRDGITGVVEGGLSGCVLALVRELVGRY